MTEFRGIRNNLLFSNFIQLAGGRGAWSSGLSWRSRPFTASGTSLRQPVEATYQFPITGGVTMTVGKYCVPFGIQEWKYEPKYGAMFQSAHGATSFTGSLNYNFSRKMPNIYLRIGRQLSPRTIAGMSTGGGRGLFSDLSHAPAFGVDLTHDFVGVQFCSEYNYGDGANSSFQYVSGKLTFTKTGRFLPYLGAYYRHDSAQELGNFSSLVGELGYGMSRCLTDEDSYAGGKHETFSGFSRT